MKLKVNLTSVQFSYVVTVVDTADLVMKSCVFVQEFVALFHQSSNQITNFIL